jgi:hypothetical protein
VELGDLNQREHGRGTLAAAVGAGKQPGLATDRVPRWAAFFARPDAAVVEERTNDGLTDTSLLDDTRVDSGLSLVEPPGQQAGYHSPDYRRQPE